MRQRVWLRSIPCGGMLSQTRQPPKPDRLSSISFGSSAVFWFLFWFEGWFHPLSDDVTHPMKTWITPNPLVLLNVLKPQAGRDGTRGEGRTLNLRLRRPTLYPIELLAQDETTLGQSIPGGNLFPGVLRSFGWTGGIAFRAAAEATLRPVPSNPSSCEAGTSP